MAIGDLLKLCQEFSKLPKLEADAFCDSQTDLVSALPNIIRQGQSRQSGLVNSNVVQQWVTARVAEQDDAFKAVFNEMLEISERCAAQDTRGKYQPDHLQAYAAASLVCAAGHTNVAQIAPGQGKSFILMLLALYYRAKHPMKRVVILTTSELLVKQLTSELKPFVNEDTEIVIDTELLPNAKPSVVIVDEADLWVAENACVFHGDELAGLYCLRNAGKAHLLSATITPFMGKILGQLTSHVAPDFLVKVPTKFTLSNQHQTHEQIAYKSFDDELSMHKSLSKDIRETMLARPVLVFSDKPPSDMAEILTKLLAKTKIETITTEAEAEHCRKFHKSRILGIYVIATDFARGYDLKLATDCYVCVVAYEGSFSNSVVNQMVGRGSRAFGQAMGAFYTTKFGDVNENIQGHLIDMEPEYHNSYLTLGRLYTQYASLDDAEKATVVQAFAEGRWNVPLAKMEKAQPKLMARLSGGSRNSGDKTAKKGSML